MRKFVPVLLSSAGIAVLGATTGHADPVSTPSMSAPLATNPDPFQFDAGPLGNIHITGAISGLGLWQDNPFPGDRTTDFDVSSAQVFVQKNDGLFQFFVQIGDYSVPSLGAIYVRSNDMVSATYGVAPQAFVKIAPADNFSIQAGKLPTLVGSEYTFTFENMNIERGLLWNQEPAVSRGVQVNYSSGPLSAAISVNDGYYSNRFNWVSGSATWTIDSSNALTFVGAGNLGRTSASTFAAPKAQNNSAIFNLIYAYNAAPWSVEPYLQYSHVPADATLGFAHSAESYGVGLLGTYAFTPSLALAGRVEYESTSGNAASPNLLYGPNSKAWSVTLTPTWQHKLLFVRGEVSYVGLNDVTPGFGLGSSFDGKSQVRGLLETGIDF